MRFRISQYVALQNIAQVSLGLLMIGFVQWHLIAVFDYGNDIDRDQQTLLQLQKYGSTMSNILIMTDLILSGGNTYLIKIVFDSVGESEKLIRSLKKSPLYPSDLELSPPEAGFQTIAETVRLFTTVGNTSADSVGVYRTMVNAEQTTYDEAAVLLVDHYNAMYEHMVSAAKERKMYEKKCGTNFSYLPLSLLLAFC